MMKFYFVRHGQSEANLLGHVAGGNVDTPLTELGRQQALDVSKRIKTLNLHKIYHSPMMRAHDTAKLINEEMNLPMHKIHDLREWDLGDWHGISPQELRDNVLEKGLEPPQGEIRNFYYDRVYNVFQNIFEESTLPFLVVAHGGTFDAMVRRLCVQHDIEWVKNCALIEVSHEFDIWRAIEI